MIDFNNFDIEEHKDKYDYYYVKMSHDHIEKTPCTINDDGSVMNKYGDIIFKNKSILHYIKKQNMFITVSAPHNFIVTIYNNKKDCNDIIKSVISIYEATELPIVVRPYVKSLFCNKYDSININLI